MSSNEYHDFIGQIDESKDAIVGRRKELEILLASLVTGRHVLLEGPPGTSKSTLLRYITSSLKLPLFQIEGSADLTPAKLIGTFNPNLVLEQGFKAEFFEKGPLVRAMEEGGILYIEELNRAAPDATNALIRAIEEGEAVIPRYGVVQAAEGFRTVMAMNPLDDTGVTRISRALLDRLTRIRMDYQGEQEEMNIVKKEVNSVPDAILKIGVRIAHATRYDDRLRQGSSVRGAIDFSKLCPSLALIRGSYTADTIIDAAMAAFTGKIWLENPNHSEEEIILQIVETVISKLPKAIYEELNLDLKKKTRKT